MGYSPTAELAATSERDFEHAAFPYLRLVFPGIIRPAPRQAWDRRGVDLMTTPEVDPIEVCVQCKTTMKARFEIEDLPSLTAEIDKFVAAGVKCERYILALNRNDKGLRIRETLVAHLGDRLPQTKFEVWELSEIVKHAEEAVEALVRERVIRFNAEWRDKLSGRFAPSGAFIRKVPAQSYRMMIDWDAEPELRERSSTQDIDTTALLLDCLGPKLSVLIGDDGTGKTTAALLASRSDDRTVIFVPAAGLDGGAAGGSTNGLMKEVGRVLDVRPRVGEVDRNFLYLLGRALTAILRKDASVTLIIDGLDENRVFRGFNGLRLVRSQLKGLVCRAILSTRTKHFNLRAGDFSLALQDKGKIGRRNRGVRIIELRPWTETTIIRHITDVSSGLPSVGRTRLTELIDTIRRGEASGYYGTLLSHPIFLDLIIDDVAAERVQHASRTSLVRRWILRKIQRDQGKYDGEPLRGDTTQEARLIFGVLEELALQMSDPETRTPIERISHADVSRLIAGYGLDSAEVFELLLKSVLVVVGLETVSHDAGVMFSHRLFHEYMIAAALLHRSAPPPTATPPEIISFYDELKTN